MDTLWFLFLRCTCLVCDNELNVYAKIVDDAAVKAKAHAKSIGCK